LGEDDRGPIERFENIFEMAELQYESTPVIEEKGGVFGVGTKKMIVGNEVHIDTLSQEFIKPERKNIVHREAEKQVVTQSIKHLSLKKLSEKHEVHRDEIHELVEKEGLVEGKSITPKGQQKGLVMKAFRVNEYIAYPEDLKEFNVFLN
jgi:beta-N-acetylglucosaminidase